MTLVSCICPTCGRPPTHQHLIEEAIESFLRQDWPDKELIVLNDTPEQQLICDAPGVLMINHTERYATLGGKFNAAIEMSHGELICPWEDDDICLPWRLSQAVERLGDCDVWNPRGEWFLDRVGLHDGPCNATCHAASVFRRSAWEALGGYPLISGAQDQAMDGLLHMHCKVSRRPLTNNHEWSYIYRWGVSPRHLSSRRPHEDHYNRIGQTPVQPGTYELQPHWAEDYMAMCLAKPLREA